MFWKHILLVEGWILVLESTGSDKWKWVFHSEWGKICTKVLRTVRSATLQKSSDLKKQNPQFPPITPNVSITHSMSSKLHFGTWINRIGQMDMVFLSDRDKTCTKVLRTVRSLSWWKFSYPKNQNPQLSPNLSKCFKNTFSELKASFWYLIHPDRTCGSEFFTQIGVKLAQKCSERRDLQICENFLTPKIKIHNFHPTSPNVSKTHFTS